MYVHEDANLIYLAHPRTASLATVDTLQELGFRKKGDKHHSKLDVADRERWTVFTTVRNHFDAAVSWAFYLKSQIEVWDISLFDFALNNGWVKPNTMWHLHSPDADRIIRYENIDADLNTVLTDAGLPAVKLKRVHESGEREYRHYREFFVEETCEYIEQRFWDEMRRYGYEY